MEFKLIIKDNEIQGAEIKTNLDETLLFSKALRTLYFSSTNKHEDPVILKQMLLKVEKEYEKCLK